MKKIIFLLSTCSFCFVSSNYLVAQENNHNNTPKIINNNLGNQSAYGLLTEAKWNAIARRYYQSRLRTNFSTNNHLLNIWDVKQMLGFPGIKLKESSVGNRQYWVWIDRRNPQRKIRATFNYYQLVDLKGSEFESVSRDFIRSESIDRQEITIKKKN